MNTEIKMRDVEADNFGLEVGNTYLVRYDSIYEHEGYPWNEASVPVEILEEYPKFFLVKVLEHQNPRSPFGTSRPYKVTIDKVDIVTKNMIVKNIDGTQLRKTA